MSKEKQYRYSEIFRSIQGEGEYTGVTTAWLRLWGCNFSCQGFGQKDLDNPSTWELPYLDFDPKSIIAVDQLPVWHTGCDSSYSFAKQFRHLAQKCTVPEIVDNITEVLKSPWNPTGTFLHEKSKMEQHLALTGGEPMMSQAAILAIMEEFAVRKNAPRFVTVETNGTQPIKEELTDFIHKKFYPSEDFGGIVQDARGTPEWFWSVSPKLRASGEKWEDAIKPEVLAGYSDASDAGQLKFVVDGTERTWYEVDKAVEAFREEGIMWPVWIMPVGADLEGQNNVAASICDQAQDRGFNTAARVHVYVYGNAIGR
jgi:organic radical activating enzyme